MSAGGRQSTVGGNALAKVSVNGTHLEAQMGALLSSVILPHHALEMPCAGYGRCGKCRVVAHGALSALSDAEREHLSPQDISRGVRLACCARVEGDCTVTLEGAAASQIRLAGEMPDFVHDPIFSVCGAAVDIGTTTLASCLYGPDGTLLAQASAPNPQAGWGADVISRIEAALHGSGDALAASVRAGVRALVLEMAASAHISAEAVDALVITGNTAMLYLLTQTDPDCLSHAPFAASRLFGETLAAGELGLPPMRRYICPLYVRFCGCGHHHGVAGQRHLLQAGHPHAGGYWNQRRDRSLASRAAFLLLHGRRARL